MECRSAIPMHYVSSISEDGGDNEAEVFSYEFDGQGRPVEIDIYHRNGPDNGHQAVIKLSY